MNVCLPEKPGQGIHGCRGGGAGAEGWGTPDYFHILLYEILHCCQFTHAVWQYPT